MLERCFECLYSHFFAQLYKFIGIFAVIIHNSINMKKLFLSVMALTISAFAFMSCEDKEDIDNGKGGGKAKPGTFLTVQQQQSAINGALSGVADVIDFTDLSQVAEIASGIIGRDLKVSDLISMISDSAIISDTLFQARLVAAATLFATDSVVVDLEPLYMEGDIYVIDTMKVETIYFAGEGGSAGSYVDTTYYTMLKLENLKYDVNHLRVNVFVDGHKIVLTAKAKAGESSIEVKNEEKKSDKKVILPTSAMISLSIDDKPVFELSGEYKSDFSLLVEDGEDDDFYFNGSKIYVKGSLKLTDYEFDGEANLDIEKGADITLTGKYAGNELISVGAKVNADFRDVDLENDTIMLAWAQNPEKLKSISLNASLGAGKIELKGSLDSPFKDKELAASLRKLMVPDVTLTKDESEKVIAKLNEILNVGLYFEGYKDPQAKLKLIYAEPDTEDMAGTKGDGMDGYEYETEDEDEDGGFMASIMELFAKIGAYPVLEVRDDDGNLTTMPVMEYFSKIDVSPIVQGIPEKFNKAFGPYLNKSDNGGIK